MDKNNLYLIKISFENYLLEHVIFSSKRRSTFTLKVQSTMSRIPWIRFLRFQLTIERVGRMDILPKGTWANVLSRRVSLYWLNPNSLFALQHGMFQKTYDYVHVMVRVATRAVPSLRFCACGHSVFVCWQSCQRRGFMKPWCVPAEYIQVAKMTKITWSGKGTVFLSPVQTEWIHRVASCVLEMSQLTKYIW